MRANTAKPAPVKKPRKKSPPNLAGITALMEAILIVLRILVTLGVITVKQLPDLSKKCLTEAIKKLA